ncbi:MAG: hypothetical protein RMM53_11895, partial [Bacteroidia bacterium]|nr:hypothetical protein [Bacteroidia bacterium]
KDKEIERKLTAGAYYERLARFFQWFNDAFKEADREKLIARFNSNFPKLEDVWRDLEKYVCETLKGDFGVWRLKRDDTDPHVHVRIPRSQLIFKPVHLSRDLPEFFKKIVRDEPSDWSAVVEHPEFKQKFKNAYEFDDKKFVLDFLKDKWREWREQKQKERPKSRTTSSLVRRSNRRIRFQSRKTTGSGVKTGSRKGSQENGASPRVPGTKREIVELFWCYDSKTKDLKLCHRYEELELDGKSYSYNEAMPRHEVEKLKEKFRLKRTNLAKHVVVLKKDSEVVGADYIEFLGENVQESLQGADVVFVCPPEKKDVLTSKLQGLDYLCDCEGCALYRCRSLRNADVLVDHLGLKPRINGLFGLPVQNQKRTFFNFFPIIVEIAFANANADAKVFVRNQNGEKKSLEYLGTDDDKNGVHRWRFPDLLDEGEYFVFFEDKSLHKTPITLVEAQISPEVGARIPWRNVYGERSSNDKIPRYRAWELNAAAYKALNLTPQDKKIAEIVENLELEKSKPLPEDVVRD